MREKLRFVRAILAFLSLIFAAWLLVLGTTDSTFLVSDLGLELKIVVVVSQAAIAFLSFLDWQNKN